MEDEKIIDDEAEKALTLKSLGKKVKLEIAKLQRDVDNLKKVLRR